MFAVSGVSQTEIFGHNTKSLTFLKKLGKFINWLKNNVGVLKLQTIFQVLSWVFSILNHFQTIFKENYKNGTKIHITIYCH